MKFYNNFFQAYHYHYYSKITLAQYEVPRECYELLLLGALGSVLLAHKLLLAKKK